MKNIPYDKSNVYPKQLPPYPANDAPKLELYPGPIVIIMNR
jgi:hypothetical protein